MLILACHITCHNPGDYCNCGVSGAKWQRVSPYRVSILFAPRLRCYSVGLAPLGFWTEGPKRYTARKGYGKKTVLEFLSSTTLDNKT